jgi:hypothetical protein
MAGFEVIIYGRFWVIAEGHTSGGQQGPRQGEDQLVLDPALARATRNSDGCPVKRTNVFFAKRVGPAIRSLGT